MESIEAERTPRPRRRGGSSTLAVLLVMTALGVTVVGALWFTCGLRGCPDVETLRSYIPEEASVVLDRRGEEIGRLYRVQRRIVPLDSLPEYVPAAFVAVEDQRFWTHNGVDWLRVPGALLANVRSRGVAQGFSTITMQLARNLFPDRLPARQRTAVRKLAEMRVAMAIEDRFGKRDILQMYLNQIYFGRGAWGIEAAAQEYFGKPATALTLPEAALLAALPQAPSRINPRDDRAAARARRDLVLTEMARQGWVTAAQAAAAKRAAVTLRRGSDEDAERNAPYFLEAVREVLERQFGEGVYTGGLRIHTTLDLPTQRVAEAELERQLEAIERGAYGSFRDVRYGDAASRADAEGGPSYLQGALVILDAATGDALAWVGGRDFGDSRYDRVTEARRQPGSAFKPFVYAAAVQAGYPPTYRLTDTPVRFALDRHRSWAPKNYDGVFKGPVTMEQALTESRNVPTIELARAVGLDRVIDTAHQLGIESELPAVASLPLGVGGVTPLELTDAYAAFATLGSRPEPRLVPRVEDRDGNVVWEPAPQATQVLDPAVAFVMNAMLRGVVDRGTGMAVRAAGFGGPAGGKTGTTNDGADAWFVGFTPRLVAGIWIGFDRPRPIAEDASGGHLAAPVWGRIMARVASGRGGWQPPPGVERLWVEPTGAVLAGDCPPPTDARSIWFVQGTAPAAGCAPAGYAAADSTPWGDTLLSADSVAPSAGGWLDRLRRRLFGPPPSSVPPAAEPWLEPRDSGPVEPLPAPPVAPPEPADTVRPAPADTQWPAPADTLRPAPADTLRPAPERPPGERPLLGRPVRPSAAPNPGRPGPGPPPARPPALREAPEMSGAARPQDAPGGRH
ncbi:MAG: PBP1A family penicillin-binding protein [Gemmatimonadetes bacterium]|nr:PBP1A family penicillin-binding protein [Gemmatimonadota bacterium]